MNNMKKNIIWNTIGSIAISITSLFYTIILTRYSTIDQTGLYTIAFALACNTTILAAFGGKIYQVTDTKGDINTFSYIISRYFTIIYTIVIMLSYLLTRDYSFNKSLVIMLICIFKYLEELSDVYYGVMQKGNALYKVGMFQTIKSIINVVLFLILIISTNNLVIVFSILILLSLIFIIIERITAKNIDNWNNIFNKSDIKKYFKSNILICILGFLTTYIINIPKYSIDTFLNSYSQVVFGIIVMPTTAMLLLNNFILNPFIVSIAENYNNNKILEVKSIIKRLFKIVLLIGLVGLIICYFIGIPVLNIIYSLDLSDYKLGLLIIIIGSIFYTLTAMISNILVALRIIKKQIFANLIVILISLFIGNYLVNTYGVLGASICFSLLIILRFIMYLLIMKKSLKINNGNKVLHLLSTNSFSGAENVACAIIENNSLYESFYCSPNGPIKKVLKSRGIKYILINSLNPFEIRKICRKYNINIIHAHDYKASFVAVLSGFDGKIISHLHGNVEFSKTWNIYTIIYNLIINRFHKIVVVSQSIITDSIFAKKHMDKFVVIPNIVDKKNIIKKSNEFKAKKYDLIYLGRLEPVKNPELVIEIVNVIVKEKPNIKVCMIGDGSLKTRCRDLIKKYKLSNNIDLLGFVSNPFPYIKSSKVGLLTSIHEGIPLSIIECMSLDVPILNSGVDGLKYLFKNNKKFICNDIMDYCKKVNDIIDGNNDYKKECKSIIEKYIDVKSYIEKINKIY